MNLSVEDYCHVLAFPKEAPTDVLLQVLGNAVETPLPFWSIKLWGATETGNCQTWNEFWTEVSGDKKNYRDRIKKIKQDFAPIVDEIPGDEKVKQKYIVHFEKLTEETKTVLMFDTASQLRTILSSSSIDAKKLHENVKKGLDKNPEQLEALEKIFQMAGVETE